MAQQISDAELEIMRIIWACGGTARFASIMEELASKGKTWQKNTVITLLSRLTDKGILKTKKIGRRNEYTAVVSESAYQTAQTKRFLNQIYEGNVKGLVVNLIQNDILSAEEYSELKELLDGGSEDR